MSADRPKDPNASERNGVKSASIQIGQTAQPPQQLTAAAHDSGVALSPTAAESSSCASVDSGVRVQPSPSGTTSSSCRSTHNSSPLHPAINADTQFVVGDAAGSSNVPTTEATPSSSSQEQEAAAGSSSQQQPATSSSGIIRRRKRHGQMRERTAVESSDNNEGQSDEADGDVLMVVDRRNSDAARRAGVAVRDSSSSSPPSAADDWDDAAGLPELLVPPKSRRRLQTSDDTSSSSAPPDADTSMESVQNDDDDDDELEIGPQLPPGAARPQPRADEDASSTDGESARAINVEQLLAGRPWGNWRSVPALRNREYGTQAHRALSSQDWFRYRAVGSQYCVERMDCMWKLRKHEGCVNALNFNASGSRLCSGSDDTNVVIWDWLYNKDLLTFDTGHTLNVFQCKFMPLSGDCHIVTCARDGQVRLAELSNTGECRGTRRLATHSASAHKLSVEHESPHVFISCGEDAVVYQVDLRDQHPNKILVCRNQPQQRKVPLYSIQSNPVNANYFAVSGRDTFCRIYDKRRISDGLPVKSFCPHRLLEADFKPHVTCIAYNHNGTELLASYNDDDVYCFDTTQSDGADYTFKYVGHRNNATVKGVNWYGPNSEFVISGSDCGHVYFWERKSQAIVHFVPADEGGVVNVLEPHPTCAALAVSGLDHDVKIFLPVADEEMEFDKAKLTELVKENCRQRMRERMHPDPDADFIYYILRQIMRRRRRQGRVSRGGAGGASDSSSTTEPELSDHDEDDDDDMGDDDEPGNGGAGGPPSRAINPAQCRTS